MLLVMVCQLPLPQANNRYLDPLALIVLNLFTFIWHSLCQMVKPQTVF
jgi:hypothetical protein